MIEIQRFFLQGKSFKIFFRKFEGSFANKMKYQIYFTLPKQGKFLGIPELTIILRSKSFAIAKFNNL
jgi:hypothetical protein